MSNERVNITYNTVEAIDFVLQSGDEDIGEVVDNNDSSGSSKYEEDKHDNVTLIQNNEPGENLDTVEQGDTVGVSQIQRPKKKPVLRPVKSLDTSRYENNYDSYNPSIAKRVLNSEIDKVIYQWIATTSSTGRVNAANIMALKPDPQKQARNKLAALDIWRQLFTNKIIIDILLYTGNKISNIRSELPCKNLQNDTYLYINIITESELLAFFQFYVCQGVAWSKSIASKKLFSNEIGHPIFSATTNYNNMLFI